MSRLFDPAPFSDSKKKPKDARRKPKKKPAPDVVTGPIGGHWQWIEHTGVAHYVQARAGEGYGGSAGIARCEKAGAVLQLEEGTVAPLCPDCLAQGAPRPRSAA